MGTAVLLVLIVGAFIGVTYVWSALPGERDKPGLSAWRRKSAMVGLIAVTAQAAIFVTFWTPLFRTNALIVLWVRNELLLFLIAIPCVLAGAGPSRWWLALSSTALMIGSFLT